MEAIEALLDAPADLPTGAAVGTTTSEPGAGEAYATWVAAAAGLRLDGMRIVVDCAHGAAATVAPNIFHQLGADVTLIGCDPDGININVQCGSTHLDHVAAAVRTHGAELGVAFDGDADRLGAVDADELAASTYKLNHPKTHVVTGDIRKVDAAELMKKLKQKPNLNLIVK